MAEAYPAGRRRNRRCAFPRMSIRISALREWPSRVGKSPCAAGRTPGNPHASSMKARRRFGRPLPRYAGAAFVTSCCSGTIRTTANARPRRSAGHSP